jgi:hypothetical protein
MHCREPPVGANLRLMHCNKWHFYSIISADMAVAVEYAKPILGLAR